MDEASSFPGLDPFRRCSHNPLPPLVTVSFRRRVAFPHSHTGRLFFPHKSGRDVMFVSPLPSLVLLFHLVGREETVLFASADWFCEIVMSPEPMQSIFQWISPCQCQGGSKAFSFFGLPETMETSS